jgi:uncharacterized membrane protein
VSSGHGVARVLGGLVAFLGLAICLSALFFLGLLVSHYNASGAQYALQLILAFAISGVVAVLGGQFALSPEHRPRLIQACVLLLGGLVCAGLMGFLPPPAFFLFLLIAITCAGGAWIIGARVS